MEFFEIEGGAKLKGEINIPGAKNAALPMFCAALLTTEKCVFRNVPDISDLHNLCEIFNEIGVETSWDLDAKTVEICAKNLDTEKLAISEKVKKMRASILMAGPILARVGEFSIFAPGGCVIGARSNEIHTGGFETLGAKLIRDDERLELKFSRKDFTNKRILFSEASVTGTENLAIFSAGVEDEVELYFTAAEPHVQAILRMLRDMGAEVSGIGKQKLKICGSKNLKGGEFEIPSDGLLAGTYAIAGWLTGGELKINNVTHEDLFSFYGACKKINANFEMEDNVLRVLPSPNLVAIPKVQTAIFPGFSTDLQSPFGVLLTQCKGTSKVFETLFENRLSYLAELEKMGAKIEILNSHEARIFGQVKLKGSEVQSWDLRAGAAMVLAGLIAEGTTRVTNIDYIDRGYENFEQNLQSCGAKIKRVKT